MNRALGLIKEKSAIIKYLIFGVLTTLLNILIYHVAFKIFGISNVVSTCIAWVGAVLFAFITNRLYVFNSKSRGKDIIKEALNFILCRLGTGVVEVLMMYILVDAMSFNGVAMKTITNFIVIVLNYVASKKIVFKK